VHLNSNQEMKTGDELLEMVLALTGLPKDQIRGELDQILGEAGQSKNEEMTIDELRFAMLRYLESFQKETEWNTLGFQEDEPRR
jgi:bacterioferritin (cytochrome b1)